MGIFGRHRIKRPVDGFAEIVDTWLPPQHGAGGNCKMRLALDVPGVPPQVVKYHELLMSPNRWPEKGMRVAVTVDADHPDRVEVHWDSVFGDDGGVLGVAASLASGFGVDIDVSGGVAPKEERRGLPDDELPAAIDALNREYREGRITYEEMTAEMLRIVGT
jgi:hypothetical protein